MYLQEWPRKCTASRSGGEANADDVRVLFKQTLEREDSYASIAHRFECCSCGKCVRNGANILSAGRPQMCSARRRWRSLRGSYLGLGLVRNVLSGLDTLSC